METDPLNTATSQPPPTTDSPWITYLTGKPVSAESFLSDMAFETITVQDPKTGKPKKEKKRRRAPIIPDQTIRTRFNEVLATKRDRVERLTQLVQASATSSESIRHTVLELADSAIAHLGIHFAPEPLDATTFRQTVESWLSAISERPLKADTVSLLLLLIHVGWRRSLLDQATAFSLITSATTPTKKNASQTQPAQPTRPTTTLLDVLLTTKLTRQTLATFGSYFRETSAAAQAQQKKIQSQSDKIVRLMADRASLESTVAELQAARNSLVEQQRLAESRIAELEVEVIAVRDGYKHRIYEMRERTRGVLQGQITRWLQTALDAAQSTPARIAVIQERLEDSLKLIEKEISWLRPSD